MVGKPAHFAVTFLLLVLTASAQTPAPTVSFTFDFPGSEPEHYVIFVTADGHGHYESDGKLSPDAEKGDAVQSEFSVTPEFRNQIFQLAKRAHYFSDNVDSKKNGIASTGKKTLAYKDENRNSQATYNYSPNPAVQELTSMFQGLGGTLEFGRRLEYYYRYQKLALADELKRMEEMANNNSLQQVGAISGTLRKIANDQSVINVVRMRAERLLIKSGAAGGQ
jgi:hypothetical protein